MDFEALWRVKSNGALRPVDFSHERVMGVTTDFLELSKVESRGVLGSVVERATGENLGFLELSKDESSGALVSSDALSE